MVDYRSLLSKTMCCSQLWLQFVRVGYLSRCYSLLKVSGFDKRDWDWDCVSAKGSIERALVINFESLGLVCFSSPSNFDIGYRYVLRINLGVDPPSLQLIPMEQVS